MKILIVFLSSLFVSFRISSCLELDVILVLDMSDSVNGYENFIADATTAFINRFDLDEREVKIGIVGFSSSAWTFQELSSDKEKLLVVPRAIRLMTPTGSTDLTSALYKSLDEFTQHGRPGYRKMIILVSDGAPDSPQDAEEAAKLIQMGGIGLCGVLINSFSSRSEYMARICPCYAETSYEKLADELKKLDVCM